MSAYQLRVEVQYGRSPHPVGCFWPGSASGSISVGTRGAWRVDAPGVAEYAAYLYSDGTQLFVTAINPAEPVVVNGIPLTQGYRPVHHGDTMEFGQARFSVSAIQATPENYVAPPDPIGEGPPPPPFVQTPFVCE